MYNNIIIVVVVNNNKNNNNNNIISIMNMISIKIFILRNCDVQHYNNSSSSK